MKPTKQMKSIFAASTVFAAIVSTASAATSFTNADVANSFISTEGNWSNGLPTAINPGTLAINGQYSSAVTHTGYNVTHSAGLLSLLGTGTLALSGGTWLMNGTATYSGRGIALTNSNAYTVDLGTGTANYSNNNVDMVISSSSTMLVTSGNIFGGRSLGVNGGTFTMNSSGTVSFNTTAYFGSNPLSGTGSIMNLNAGTITANRFALRSSAAINFGGSVAGSATFADWGTGLYTNTADRVQDNAFTLNFTPTTLMTLTLSSAARALDFTNNSINDPTGLAWAEALWGQNQLLYNGQSATALGLDWATVTTTGFGDGKAFDFDPLGSFGGSLVVVPEPSSSALLALGMAALVSLRKRREA